MLYKHSLSSVLTLCSSLHAPAPISDDALTLIMYSIPASSPVSVVEFTGGETEELIHELVLLALYSTSYSVMGNSLWGVVQDTVRVKFPSSSDLVTNTSVTLEGTVRQMLEWSIPLHLLHTNMVRKHTCIIPYTRESSTSCVLCTYT